MATRLIGIGLVAVLVTTACATQSPPAASPSPLHRNPAAFVEEEPYDPNFDPANFGGLIDNPYLPLLPGTELVYKGISDGEREVIEITVTNETKTVLGVTAVVVRDRVFVTGKLAEDTFDWFAQDRQGNVWYLGEDTKEYENGKVVSTEGSWEAGVDGAQPGIIMLADPQIADTYRQEFYEGEAEDLARVVGLDESVTGPAGSFDQVLKTEEWTPLEPKFLENKFYARGVGVVLERRIKGGEEVVRLVEFRR
jgi:hypothetical protein